jgi:hypothetical protein
MAECGECGEEFSGTAWKYRTSDGRRVHADCTLMPNTYVPKPMPAILDRVAVAELRQEQEQVRWRELAESAQDWSTFAYALAHRSPHNPISRHQGETLVRIVREHDPAVVDLWEARSRMRGVKRRARRATR